MKPIFLLVHGWGFDASFWAPMRDALGDIESVVWDLGFRGTPTFPRLPSARSVVAVGHSYGLLWLLRERPVAWQTLVSINGFPRFTDGDDFPCGVPVRLLDRMIARFAETPEKVYIDFMARSGLAEPQVQGLDYAMLADGLNGLRHWDERGRIAGLGLADLVLAGRNDPIVPGPLTENSFAGSDIRWHEGGHLLPIQAPLWCARQLRKLNDRLNGIEPAGMTPGEE